MDERFERKSRKINEKKFLITEKYMNELCRKKTNMSDDEIKKQLEKYARKMERLEKRKYGFRSRLVYKEYKGKGGINGGFVYGMYSTTRSVIRNSSVLRLNYNNVIEKITNSDEKVRYKGFLKYVETVHHELGHLEQNVATEGKNKIRDVSPVEALKYAIESVKLDLEDGKEKEKNYYKQITEENARQRGLNAVIDIFGGKDEYKEYINDMKKDRLEKTNDEYFIELEEYDENGIFDRTTRNCKAIDTLSHESKENYLKQYPILKKMYGDVFIKNMYHLTTEYMNSKKKIENRIFLSKENKEKNIKDINDLYSEMFWYSLSQSSNEELIDTKKMVGDENFNYMLNITKNYFNEQSLKYSSMAKNKYLVSEKIYGSNQENQDKYNNMMQKINYRFNSINQVISDIECFSKDNPTEKMSNDDIRASLKQEKEMEQNIKKFKPDEKLPSWESKITVYGEAKQTIDIDSNVNLEQMRDVRDEYKELEGLLFGELEETKKEYYDILELNKNKELVQKNKEM